MSPMASWSGLTPMPRVSAYCASKHGLIGYAGALRAEYGRSGLGVTTLCPGGKERMRRLIEVVASGRVDLKPLVTHRYKLEDIEAAYDLFAHQRDGVLKIAVTP